MKHFVAEKLGGEVDYQYGDWLRASSGHQRSPPNDKTASPKQQPRRSVNQGVVGNPRALHVKNKGINLDIQQSKLVNDEVEKYQEGKSIVEEDMHNLNSNYDIPEDVHDSKIGNGDVVESNLNSKTPKDMLDPIIEEEVVGNLETISENLKNMHDMQGGELSGPKVSKLRSTWTRIVRMDFGLGSAIKAVDVPKLGKRVSAQNANLSIQGDEGEIQSTKREKVGQDSNDTSMRVDSHPCQEQ